MARTRVRVAVAGLVMAGGWAGAWGAQMEEIEIGRDGVRGFRIRGRRMAITFRRGDDGSTGVRRRNEGGQEASIYVAPPPRRGESVEGETLLGGRATSLRFRDEGSSVQVESWRREYQARARPGFGDLAATGGDGRIPPLPRAGDEGGVPLGRTEPGASPVSSPGPEAGMALQERLARRNPALWRWVFGSSSGMSTEAAIRHLREFLETLAENDDPNRPFLEAFLEVMAEVGARDPLLRASLVQTYLAHLENPRTSSVPPEFFNGIARFGLCLEEIREVRGGKAQDFEAIRDPLEGMEVASRLATAIEALNGAHRALFGGPCEDGDRLDDLREASRRAVLLFAVERGRQLQKSFEAVCAAEEARAAKSDDIDYRRKVASLQRRGGLVADYLGHMERMIGDGGVETGAGHVWAPPGGGGDVKLSLWQVADSTRGFETGADVLAHTRHGSTVMDKWRRLFREMARVPRQDPPREEPWASRLPGKAWSALWRVAEDVTDIEETVATKWEGWWE